MPRKPIQSLTLFSVVLFLFISLLTTTWAFMHHRDQFARLHLSAFYPNAFLQQITPFDSLSLKTAQGLAFDTHALRGKWLLVYFNTKPCTTSACQRSLQHLAKIQRSWHPQELKPVPLFMSTLPIPSDLPQSRQIVITQISQSAPLLPNHFYIVDPFGNAIARYQSTTSTHTMMNDLQQLMRVSALG